MSIYGNQNPYLALAQAFLRGSAMPPPQGQQSAFGGQGGQTPGSNVAGTGGLALGSGAVAQGFRWEGNHLVRDSAPNTLPIGGGGSLPGGTMPGGFPGRQTSTFHQDRATQYNRDENQRRLVAERQRRDSLGASRAASGWTNPGNPFSPLKLG